MEKKIKLIWDFRGHDAQKIAEHHEIHLTDYKKAHNLNKSATGVETKSPLYTIAYLTVLQSEMPAVRDALKPHRGEFCD
ncbi:hypothetical protein ACFSYG_06660 [Leeuwenhoekiella polynyae]|uniref:Uncharacterized protein n=1 Tax=Leeuwenhoekiella polynyae TaxID=1550906 RepID=A0A4V1KQL1_9FLAO|nr:hypothetical protein [Leeuwenhoekiella polynyae]AOE10762.1 hypothetical protein [uncultured bacterium]RXG21792.1 hypothetical protein DSM02_2038 [Leeuwenhoekiella polynyae]